MLSARIDFSEIFFFLTNLVITAFSISVFLFIGIFIFGLVGPYYTFGSFEHLAQRFITSGIGDSIDDFFIVSSNDTDLVDWLSFLYVGAVTAGEMWLIFTSYIATVEWIHEDIVKDFRVEFDDDESE
jgi:hypothetical protein